MGRTIYAEKHLRTYLASLAKPDGYVIGLILGQVRFSVSSNFSGRMSRSRFNICDKHKKQFHTINSFYFIVTLN